MHSKTDHRNRAAVAVVGRIYNELIVQRDLRGKHRKTIIGLDDLFAARIWQLAIADQDAESAGIEKRLVHAGNAVDHSGNSEGVVVAAPLLSRHRQASGNGAVDVGEFI